MSTTSHILPTTESENFFRLVALILDCGTEVLRKILTTHALAQHRDIDSFFLHHKLTIEDLWKKKRVLNEGQFNRIFPPNNIEADVSKFDITLLSCLLLNICNLQQEKQDVIRLRTLRNEVSGHSSKASIDNQEFHVYWSKICSVITALSKTLNDAEFESDTQSSIKNLETGPQFVRLTQDVLQKWSQEDRQLSRKLEEFMEHLSTDMKDMREFVQRRPENPVLQSIINRSSEIVTSLQSEKYVYTSQFHTAKEKILDKGSLLVSGLPGEGKSTLSALLTSEVTERKTFVFLTSAEQWTHVDTNLIETIYIEDIFGLYNFDEGKFQAWQPVLEQLDRLVNSKKMKVIISCREGVLAECRAKLKRYRLFSNEIILSSRDLSKDEKREVLKSHLAQYNKNMDECDVNGCVEAYEANIGFPYCCKLFASDTALYVLGKEYFEKPHDFFIQNLETLDKTLLGTLFLVFCYDGRLKESDATESLQTFSRILTTLGLEGPAINTNFHVQFSNYVARLSVAYLQKQEGYIRFSHNLIYESIGILYGRYNKEEVIRHCSLDFLCQRVATIDKGSIMENVIVEAVCHTALADRFLLEVTEHEHTKQIAMHQAFKDSTFVETFCEIMRKRDISESFLLRRPFISYLARCDSPLVLPMIKKCISELRDKSFALGFLRRAVENAFIYGHCSVLAALEEGFDIHLRATIDMSEEDHTIDDDIIPDHKTYISDLIGAVCRGDLEYLQETLKKTTSSQVDRDQDKEQGLVAVFKMAFVKGNLEVIRLLEEAGAPISCWCLYQSVKSCNLEVVKYAKERIRSLGQWDPHQEDIIRALEKAYGFGKEDIIDELENAGIFVTHRCVHAAVLSGQLSVLNHAIGQLKDYGLLENCMPYLVGALEKAYFSGHMEMINVLLETGVSITHACVLYASLRSDSFNSVSFKHAYVFIEHAIQKLQASRQFDSSLEDVTTAMQEAFGNKDLRSVCVLEEAGALVTPRCVLKAAQANHLKNMKYAEKKLKENNLWDPNHSDIIQALEIINPREKAIQALETIEPREKAIQALETTEAQKKAKEEKCYLM